MTVEPTFEVSIGVEPNASYWLRGRIPVIGADGKDFRHLTSEYADITGIAWSADSKEVWYTASFRPNMTPRAVATS